MVLGAKSIRREVDKGNRGDQTGISIVPSPDTTMLEEAGEASVSLRLGRWFLTLRQSSETHLDTSSQNNDRENRFSKSYFVPFGRPFILHPNRFVLASTLEWIRLPPTIAAFVVGKSTLGRRGIIIETASGVHPGFSGCLTLEIANVGEVPVKLTAGMMICQLFFHSVEGSNTSSKTSLAGQRKPRLGRIKPDPILEALIPAAVPRR